MRVLTKAVAEIRPADDEDASPNGAFEVILSAPTQDRDGETLRSEEWQQPLPEHITFDVDHGMSVATTVGSGRPWLDEAGKLRVSGTYSSIPRAQEVRTLVKEGHIRTTSVAFMTEQQPVKGGTPRVVRELLNGAFVAVPSNRDALILASKGVTDAALKVGRRNSAADSDLIQQIHDLAAQLGADCGSDDEGPDDDTGAAEDAEGGKSVKDGVSNAAWSDITQADYSIEQWRHACLIGPSSPSDNKSDYSLPVREPDGQLNRAACHAAAGRINQVDAPSAEKAAAARNLVGLYRNQLKETPPDALLSMAGSKHAHPHDPGTTAAHLSAAADTTSATADDDAAVRAEITSRAMALYGEGMSAQ
jgi:hypothetical protein